MSPSNTLPRRVSCPFCGKVLNDLERVESKHTPASVPEHVKGYSVTRRYVIARCENEHMVRRVGSDIYGLATGPTAWRY